MIASTIVKRCHLPRSMLWPLNSVTVVPFTSLRDERHQVFGDLHQVVVVRVGLVELEHRELGVVLRAHALVAEVAIDLVDAVESADDKALEIKLRRDAQEQILVERVVVGAEGPRRRAAGDLLHHRRFDFQVAALVEESADCLQQPWRA